MKNTNQTFMQVYTKAIDTLMGDLAALEKLFNRTKELYGPSHEGAFYKTIYELETHYIDTTAKLVGDNAHWLTWYVYENRRGKGKLKVVSSSGEQIEVSNTKDLLKCIQDSW